MAFALRRSGFRPKVRSLFRAVPTVPNTGNTRRMKHSRTLLGASFLLASLVPALAACSDGAASAETSAVGRSQSAIIKGKASTSAQDAVILLVHYEAGDPGVGACSGTLLSNKIVLTARHCVAQTDEAAACDEKGNPIQGGSVSGNHDPKTLYVFTGKNRPDFSGGEVKPAARGAKILDTGAKTLCNNDVAVLILDQEIPNALIAPVRLDGDTTKGETITAVGWGVTDQTAMPDVRQQRSGVKITAVGPDADALPAVSPNEFQVGESICSGDSGGPAFADSGAVIGVVSRGGNGRGQTQSDPSAACINAENLYSKVQPFKSIIEKAFEITGQEPWVEGGPDPRLATAGTACSDGAECRSSLCLADPSQAGATTCAADCSSSDCPDGQTCQTEGDAKVCRTPEQVAAAKAAEPKTTTTTGCSATPTSGSSSSANAGLSLGLAALGLVLVRRRRQA